MHRARVDVTLVLARFPAGTSATRRAPVWWAGTTMELREFPIPQACMGT